MSGAWVRTAATAIAIVTALFALSLLVQVAALGRQNHPQLFVTRVIGALEHYHASTAAITIDGRRLTSVCRQRVGAVGHIAQVSLDDGITLVKVGNTLDRSGLLAADEFVLAGCPRPLMAWLTRQLGDGRQLDLSVARVDGRSVTVLRVPGAGYGLALTLDGKTPTRLTVRGAGVRGTSEVTYFVAPPTPWIRLPPHRRGEASPAAEEESRTARMRREGRSRSGRTERS